MRLFDNLIAFAKETSIHGFVQMANASYSYAKRIVWFILFCISIIYAGFQISDDVKCKSTINIIHCVYLYICYSVVHINWYAILRLFGGLRGCWEKIHFFDKVCLSKHLWNYIKHFFTDDNLNLFVVIWMMKKLVKTLKTHKK